MPTTRILAAVLPVFFTENPLPLFSTDLLTLIVLLIRSTSVHVRGISSPLLNPEYIIIIAALFALWSVSKIQDCSSAVKARRVSAGANFGSFMALAGLYSMTRFSIAKSKICERAVFITSRNLLEAGFPVLGFSTAISFMTSCKSMARI